MLKLDGFFDQATMGLWAARPVFGGAAGFRLGAPPADAEMPDGAIYDFAPAGDLDGDGHADVLLKTRWREVMFLGAADGIVQRPGLRADTSQSFFASDGDVNGDGFSDAAIDLGVGFRLVLGAADGVGATTQDSSRGTRGSLALLDANGDAYADLAVNVEDFRLALFAGSPAGLLPEPIQIFPALPQPEPNLTFVRSPLGAGDFDGDGRPDLVTALGRGVYEIHYGRPGAPFDETGTPLSLPPKTAVTYTGIGDVDGDGFDDVTVLVYDGTVMGTRIVPAEMRLYRGGSAGLAEIPAQVIPLR